MNKSKIRRKILKVRKKNFYKNLNIDSDKLFSFLRLKKYKFKNFGGYYPSNYEIDDLEILEFLDKKNYNISLPVIKKNNQMDFFKWSNKDPLKINRYGIPEPTSSKKLYPDILFIPLVGFDNNLNRLGYGGGFYDRYINKIEKIKKVVKIGFAFSYQKLKKIPTEMYDKKLDLIITEKKI